MQFKVVGLFGSSKKGPVLAFDVLLLTTGRPTETRYGMVTGSTPKHKKQVEECILARGAVGLALAFANGASCAI